MDPHDLTAPRAAARSELAETREDPGNLLDHLDAIAVEGWDGPTATDLLRFVRSHIVRPLVVDVGLRGGAASEAEATAWEVLWLKLQEPSLRTVRSPWGVLWQTARRAVLGEILAQRWGAPPRRAWKLNAAERAGRVQRPLALEPLLAIGWQPSHDEAAREGVYEALEHALELAASALRAVGWPDDSARSITRAAARLEARSRPTSTIVGWRILARELDLAPWQARRLVWILRGSSESPGLLPRIVSEGPVWWTHPKLRQRSGSTRDRACPPPRLPRPRNARERARRRRRAGGVVRRAHRCRRAVGTQSPPPAPPRWSMRGHT